MRLSLPRSRGSRFGCVLLSLVIAGCIKRSPDESPASAVSESTPPTASSRETAQTLELPSATLPTKQADVAEPPQVNSGSVPATGDSDSTQGAPPPTTSSKPVTASENRDPEVEAAALLEQQLAELVVPPAWLASVKSSWDRARPWQEARLEIRRLLGEGDESSRHEALRLMWDYREKNDMGDGHEYSMYTFLGNEPLWAIRACREWLARDDHKYPPNFCLKSLASLYTDRGMFREAERILLTGLNWPPEEETWRRAEFLDSLGDLYVAWGRVGEARKYYQDSIQLYPQTNPPYGQHLIPRRVKVVQSKLDILSLNALDDEQVRLRDGTWSVTVPGYSGDIQVTVEVRQGRLIVVRLRHEEKIDQGATIEIPRQIVDRQSLAVDAITGATITRDAIVTGTLNALRQAGLR